MRPTSGALSGQSERIAERTRPPVPAAPVVAPPASFLTADGPGFFPRAAAAPLERTARGTPTPRASPARSSCLRTGSEAADRISAASRSFAARGSWARSRPVGSAERSASRSGFAAADLGAERLGPVRGEEGVRVVPVGQGEVLDVRAAREEERERLERRGEARRVAVVGDDDGRGVAGEEVGLRGRERGAHRGDRPREARPLARDAVEVALDEEDGVLPADRLARAVEAVEELALREARRLGRVQVLRLVVAERAGSEAEDLAARVADLDREPVAEAVVDAARLGVLLEEAGLDERLLREARAEAVLERVPRVGSRAEAEAAPSSGGRPRLSSSARAPACVSRFARKNAAAAASASDARVSRPRSARVPLRRTGSVIPARRAR